MLLFQLIRSKLNTNLDLAYANVSRVFHWFLISWWSWLPFQVCVRYIFALFTSQVLNSQLNNVFKRQVNNCICWGIMYLRNEKLQGTPYDKRRQRRIYERSNQPKIANTDNKMQGWYYVKGVLRHQKKKEQIKQDRNSGQLFRPSWDSSALCSEDM